MAAGLGFKTFNTGDVLSAADVNGYLMQGVLVFASTAARDAAITAPSEGQFAFTKDTNSLFYYDGAGWVASGATGDIEGVTAGTGISGGGTSGTVTITNSMATAIDAKGDLIGGTGADTFARLAVGANDTVLTADSTAATGLKWATPASGGGMTLLSTTTLSGTSTLISSVNQGYNNLFIIIKNINVSSATNAYVRIEPNSTTNAVAHSNVIATGGTISTQGDATFPGIPLCHSEYAASNTNNAWALEIYNYASTTSHKPFNLSGAYVNTGSATVSINSSGSYRSNTEITEFRVYSGSGSVSFNGGTVLIYGVK